MLLFLQRLCRRFYPLRHFDASDVLSAIDESLAALAEDGERAFAIEIVVDHPPRVAASWRDAAPWDDAARNRVRAAAARLFSIDRTALDSALFDDAGGVRRFATDRAMIEGMRDDVALYPDAAAQEIVVTIKRTKFLDRLLSNMVDEMPLAWTVLLGGLLFELKTATQATARIRRSPAFSAKIVFDLPTPDYPEWCRPSDSLRDQAVPQETVVSARLSRRFARVYDAPEDFLGAAAAAELRLYTQFLGNFEKEKGAAAYLAETAPEIDFLVSGAIDDRPPFPDERSPQYLISYDGPSDPTAGPHWQKTWLGAYEVFCAHLNSRAEVLKRSKVDRIDLPFRSSVIRAAWRIDEPGRGRSPFEFNFTPCAAAIDRSIVSSSSVPLLRLFLETPKDQESPSFPGEIVKIDGKALARHLAMNRSVAIDELILEGEPDPANAIDRLIESAHTLGAVRVVHGVSGASARWEIT